MIRITCSALALVLAKEESWAVITEPWMKPVSCCGKKPVLAVA